MPDSGLGLDICFRIFQISQLLLLSRCFHIQCICRLISISVVVAIRQTVCRKPTLYALSLARFSHFKQIAENLSSWAYYLSGATEAISKVKTASRMFMAWGSVIEETDIKSVEPTRPR